MLEERGECLRWDFREILQRGRKTAGVDTINEEAGLFPESRR